VSVVLSGKLPRSDANGIAAIAPALVDKPTGHHVIIALVDCEKVTTIADTGETLPTARIRAIEAFVGETTDGQEAARLLRRAMDRRRHGGDDQFELPLELERALDDLTPADPEGDDFENGSGEA
jgi:hypothetical protein